MVAPIIAGLGKALLANGFSLLANAVQEKGQAFIEEKLGVSIESSLKTTEGKRQLKQMELDHEQFLISAAIDNRKLDLEEQKLHVDNTKDARDMQKVALAGDDVFARRFIYYFAAGTAIVTATYIFTITFIKIPDTSIRFVDTILGFLLGTLLATIFNFFYGSSSSSKSKDAALQEITKIIGEKK